MMTLKDDLRWIFPSGTSGNVNAVVAVVQRHYPAMCRDDIVEIIRQCGLSDDSICRSCGYKGSLGPSDYAKMERLADEIAQAAGAS